MEDLGKISGLMRRSDAYYLRMRVPKDVQEEFGRKNILQTLSTKNYDEAKSNYFNLHGIYESKFDEIRIKQKTSNYNPNMLSQYSDFQLERIALRCFH